DQDAINHPGRTRVWHGFIARLGCKRNAFIGGESGRGGEFRTDSPLQCRWDGGVAVAISRSQKRAIARTRWVRDLFNHGVVRQSSTGSSRNARDSRQRWKITLGAREIADRYIDRN